MIIPTLIISYLIKKNEIDAKEILALAYGNDAAREVKERVKEKVKHDIESKTFHSLGRAIVQKFEASKNKISDCVSFQQLTMACSNSPETKSFKVESKIKPYLPPCNQPVCPV